MVFKKSIYLFSIIFAMVLIGFIWIKTKNYDWVLIARSSVSCIRQLVAKKKYVKNYPAKFSLFVNYLKLLSTTNAKIQNKESYFLSESVLDFTIHFSKKSNLYPLFDEIFLKQNYHFDAMTDAPFIIDCGGHIGMTTLYFKRVYPRAQILVFEPSSENFQLLTRNVENNKLKNVTIIQAALSSQEGEALLYNPGRGEASIDPTYKTAQAIEKVPTTILSKFINRDVDFLKLDIEGAETAVVEELAKQNKLRSVKEMIMEFHYDNKSINNSLSTLLGVLEGNEFTYEISSNLETPFGKLKKHNFLIHVYRDQKTAHN